MAAFPHVQSAFAQDALAPAAEQERGELLFLAVRVNDLPYPGTFLVGRDGTEYFLQRADFTTLQLIPPDVPVVRIQGRDFLPIGQIPGVRLALDAEQQTLHLDLPEAVMVAASVALSQQPVEPTSQGHVVFLNYDVAITHDGNTGGTAFLDGGYSTPLGLFSSSGLVEVFPGTRRVTRLETAFLRDDPARMRRLVVGDSFTALSQISSPVRFGGFRIGSEFALQPGLIFYPAPSLRGRSTVPTTVDVLVNNVLRQREDVSAGPFLLQDLPVVTGAGEVTLSIPDALGVERRVTTSYYVSPRLLRPGVADWSLEGGAVRRRFGERSFDYGPAFLAASYRQGLTDSVTAGGRMELGETRQAVGAEANVVVGSIVELGGGVMLSKGARGTGLRYSLSARRDTLQGSVGIRFEAADSRADRLEDLGGDIPIRWQLQASAGRAFAGFGTLAASAAEVRYRDGNRVRVLTTTYSTGIFRFGQLSAFATHSSVRGSKGRLQAGLSLAIAFGPRDSGYLQADNRGAYVEARRTPPYDGGLGYRVGVGAGKDARQQADIEWLTNSGQLIGQVARQDGRTAGRLIARGAALFGGGAVRMTRQVQDGMGIVEVPGQAGVGIYYDNRLVTHTDASGRAVVTGLRPYERNHISIDTSRMPIGTGISASDVVVVPRYRGAAQVLFDARAGRSATIRLVTPSGDPIPAGATVRVDGQARGFVGYDGDTYLVDIAAGMALDVDRGGTTCRAVLPPLGDDPLARIGPLSCKPVEASP